MFKPDNTERAPSRPRPDANRARLAAILREQASRPGPPLDCLHTRFQRQVHRAPHAVAVSCEGRHLSYQELDVLSGHLAARLRAEGVRPESRVGLYAERSVEMVVGVLAILKAGGAYVPLDPALPPERLEFQLKDSGAELVVAHGHLMDRLEGYRGAGSCSSVPRTSPTSPARPKRLDANLAVGQPGLRHLHVGLDRDPQGRARYPRQRRPPVPGDGPPGSAFDERRRVDAVPFHRVRLLRVGAVGRPAARRPARRGSLLGEPLARGLPRAARATSG